MRRTAPKPAAVVTLDGEGESLTEFQPTYSICCGTEAGGVETILPGRAAGTINESTEVRRKKGAILGRCPAPTPIAHTGRAGKQSLRTQVETLGPSSIRLAAGGS